MTTEERIIAFVRSNPHSDSVDIGHAMQPTFITHTLDVLAGMVRDGKLQRRVDGLRSWYEIVPQTEAAK